MDYKNAKTCKLVHFMEMGTATQIRRSIFLLFPVILRMSDRMSYYVLQFNGILNQKCFYSVWSNLSPFLVCESCEEETPVPSSCLCVVAVSASVRKLGVFFLSAIYQFVLNLPG